jgi:hypothetical protein
MTFSRLDGLITRCEQHLDTTGAKGTEVEQYFVQYLLICICAEYETRIASLVQRRCSRHSDAHLTSFAQGAAKYFCKRYKITEIADWLGRFGAGYKATFLGHVMSGRTHVAWTNIYSNRHAFAHEAGSPMSLGDLKSDYAESQLVLDALVVTLGMTADEIKDFK